MSEQILINATPGETRVALLQDGVLRQILIEREAGADIVGNIYLGTVVRVLRGMQAAFVDVGLQRTALVHLRDLPGADGGHPSAAPPLHQGQKIVLQAVKNPVDGKGARLSGRISIPSWYLVYVPDGRSVRVSRRIRAPAARERLQAALNAAYRQLGAGGGFILRTAAQNAAAADLAADMASLVRDWAQIRQRRRQASAPGLLHRDVPLALRAVRDSAGRAEVWVDCGETHRRVVDFAAPLMPDAASRIKHYAEDRPIFDLHAVEDGLQEALQKRVPLPSGGHLIIERTAAMTTVDVNTGSFVGTHDLAHTFLTTNLEAVTVLARQLQLRNIGGIVVVDFIDLSGEAQRAQVIAALRRELARDPTRTQFSAMSPAGLVEIIRRHSGESLQRLLTEPCPACNGRGLRHSAESTCQEIFRALLRQAHACRGAKNPAQKYRVVAAPTVVRRLRERPSDHLAIWCRRIDKTIDLQVEPNYRQEQFHVVAVAEAV